MLRQNKMKSKIDKRIEKFMNIQIEKIQAEIRNN